MLVIPSTYQNKCHHEILNDISELEYDSMNDNVNLNLGKIRSFAGEMIEEHLDCIESFMSENMALFVPVLGSCGHGIMKDHTHPCPMFIIYFDDLGLVELNGEQYRSGSDTVFFLASEMPHREPFSKTPSRYLALFISDQFFRDIADAYNACWEDFPVSGFFPTPRGLINCMSDFMRESRVYLPGREAILNGIALQTAHILVRMLFDIDKKLNIQTEPLTENYAVNRAVCHIYRHISKKITIEELSFIANLSPSHFNKLFRKEIGKTPYQYILHARLNLSLRLIDEGKLNFTEIAYRSGFSSSSHFSAAFQKEFSISPSEYQKNKYLKSGPN